MKKFFVILCLLCTGSMYAQQEDVPCNDDEIQTILSLNLDWMGNETAWAVATNPEQQVYDGNLGTIIESVSYGEYPNNVQGQIIYEEICLLSGCYTLVVFDSWGDGMGFTNGSYQLLLGDSVLASGGGNFGAWSSHIFCVDTGIETEPVFGCTDSSACNYYPGATDDDGTCLFPGSPCTHENPLITNGVFTEDCMCEGSIIYGCTDFLAVNYNPEAVVSNGECYYTPGCMISWACNYNPEADVSDGSCEFTSCLVVGCMDFYANNYNPEATTPDLGLCMYQEPSFVIVQNCKQIMIVNTTLEGPQPGPGISFTWDFGDGDGDYFLGSTPDTIIHAYANGVYTISLAYTQGYSVQSASQTIVVDDFETTPIISFEDDMIVCDQDADLYRWYCNDILVLETENNYIQLDPSNQGQYVCNLYRASGCVAWSNDLIVTSIQEESFDQFKVYPTYVIDSFIIENYTGQISVFDYFGKQILSEYIYGKTKIQFDSFAAGMYFVSTGKEMKKIVKQ